MNVIQILLTYRIGPFEIESVLIESGLKYWKSGCCGQYAPPPIKGQGK
jgi:hypothetical protein